MQPVLVPQYLRHFSCDGLACEDNCCIGNWTITVDELTFKKLKKIKHPTLKPLIDKTFKRKKNNPTPEFFAQLKQDKDLGRCIFLTANMLCKLQLELGADYLCKTCLTYPRTTNIVDGVIEESLSMSCPIAAKLALLNKNMMEFDKILAPSGKRYIINVTAEPKNPIFKDKPLKYFWEMRSFSIELLQKRNYDLEERLVIMGLLFQQVDKLVQENNVHQIPKTIDSFSALANSGYFKEQLEKIPAENYIQLKILKQLVDERVLRGINIHRYLECLSECLHGLEFNLNVPVEAISEKYIEAYNKYYLPYIKTNEHILENYLVNYAFRMLFPFSGRDTFFDNYMMLIINFCLIKMHLIGIARFNKESFGEEQTIKLIQSFSKTVEHSRDFLDIIYQLLKNNNLNNMTYMAILIRN
jgi:lysine-N-methylase